MVLINGRRKHTQMKIYDNINKAILAEMKNKIRSINENTLWNITRPARNEEVLSQLPKDLTISDKDFDYFSLNFVQPNQT